MPTLPFFFCYIKHEHVSEAATGYPEAQTETASTNFSHNGKAFFSPQLDIYKYLNYYSN